MTDDPYAAVKDAGPQGNLDTVLCQLADELLAAVAEVERIEEELVTAKEVVKDIAEVRIPTTAEGLEGKFILSNGKELEVREQLRTSIAGAKRVPAIQWLDDHDFGHLVKRELVIQFSRDDLKAFRKFQRDLMKRKKQLIIKEQFSVHHATLNAWVKEQLSDGVALPTETFGIFHQRTAKVKE